jgi:hypothetical protein
MDSVLCDKCGEPVPDSNDAIMLEMVMSPSLTLVSAPPRHLLPTDKCEGSPSRAQYLEGQPRDTRGYEYDEALEPHIRKAYATIQGKSI